MGLPDPGYGAFAAMAHFLTAPAQAAAFAACFTAPSELYNTTVHKEDQ